MAGAPETTHSPFSQCPLWLGEMGTIRQKRGERIGGERPAEQMLLFLSSFRCCLSRLVAISFHEIRPQTLGAR